MKLNTNDGISCDICNSEHKNIFKYFSYDRYLINKGNIPSSLVDPPSIPHSFDVCERCNDHIIDAILLNNKNTTIKNLKFGTFCELTGCKIQNIDYYMYRIRMIDVNLDTSSVIVDKDYLSFCSINNDLKAVFSDLQSI